MKELRLAILTNLHAYQEPEPVRLCSDCNTTPVFDDHTICEGCGQENTVWWTELYRNTEDHLVSPETLIQRVINNG